MKTAFLSSLIAAALVAFACSSSPEPASPDPGTTDPGTTDPGTTDPGTTDPGTTDPGTTDEPENAWAGLEYDEKKKIMKTKVVPAVEAIWGESPDPDHEVNCTLCHGEDALVGDFEMPNENLPKLNPADQFAAHKDEAAWLEFMSTKLVPTVADAIGVAPYDPATQTGFGCFNCHTQGEPSGESHR